MTIVFPKPALDILFNDIGEGDPIIAIVRHLPPINEYFRWTIPTATSLSWTSTEKY